MLNNFLFEILIWDKEIQCDAMHIVVYKQI